MLCLKQLRLRHRYTNSNLCKQLTHCLGNLGSSRRKLWYHSKNHRPSFFRYEFFRFYGKHATTIEQIQFWRTNVDDVWTIIEPRRNVLTNLVNIWNPNNLIWVIFLIRKSSSLLKTPDHSKSRDCKSAPNSKIYGKSAYYYQENNYSTYYQVKSHVNTSN